MMTPDPNATREDKIVQRLNAVLFFMFLGFILDVLQTIVGWLR